MRILTPEDRTPVTPQCSEQRDLMAINEKRRKGREYMAKYKEMFPEKIRTGGQKYRAKNKKRLSEKAKAYYLKNRERIVARNNNTYYQRNYKISYKEYEDMLAAQDGMCAICSTPASSLITRLFVDHNHTTGAVRGLLCHGCNTGIGFLRESIIHLENAISYLKKHSP